MNRTEEKIVEDLGRRAERFEAAGGRAPGLEDVLGTARALRRRRRVTTGLAAAAVLLAVAVPTGLAVRHGAEPRTVTPAGTGATAPARSLALGELSTGAPPATGWLDGRVWHAPGGGTLDVPARVGTLRAVASTDGGVVVGATDRQGDGEAWYVDDAGSAVRLGAMEGGLARSADGHQVAWSVPGASPEVLEDGRRPVQLLPQVGHGSGFDLVAVLAGPRAYLRSTGAGPATSWTTGRIPGGIRSEVVPEMAGVADVAPDGTLAGITRRPDPTSTCSAVQTAAGDRLWGSCAIRLLAFSPDGDRLLGTDPYGDGAGDTRLVILDARTGRPAVDLRTAPGGVVRQTSWEDDDHVLALVHQRDRWAVLRLGADGTVEYAVPPLRLNPDAEPPVLLPTR